MERSSSRYWFCRNAPRPPTINTAGLELLSPAMTVRQWSEGDSIRHSKKGSFSFLSPVGPSFLPVLKGEHDNWERSVDNWPLVVGLEQGRIDLTLIRPSGCLRFAGLSFPRLR